MSWRDQNFTKRLPISYVNVGGGSTKDVNVVIPKDLDPFWQLVDANLDEIRVTSGDGYTLLSYSVDDGSGGAPDVSSRTARIRIDGMSVPGTTDECVLAWVYFDTNDAGAQGDASVATTITSAETGTIDRAIPSTWVAVAETPRPGLDRPRSSIGKGSADAGFLFLDVTGLLEKRSSQFQGKRLFEEPRAATFSVVDDGASPQAGMIDASKSRWVEYEDRDGRHIALRAHLKAGTDGDNYTAIATIPTSVPLESGTHRTLTTRVGVRVRDVLET